jgi:hypothetical protein
MFNNILEISRKASKGGRVPIKLALLKIHEESTETNTNGIHWDETYVTNAMESAKMMPICASFLDETKSTPFDHGLTGESIDDNGIKEPLFENSETVGVIESASIENVIVGDSEIKALVGSGYLYNQRYPNFVKWVRQNHALNKVDSSIEIMGLESNDNKIVYLEDKPTDKFRTPKDFVFSGTAILSVAPADTNAVVLEVAEKNKKEENKNMEFDVNELKTVIHSAITESNSKNEELTAQIAELNSQLVDKDNTITELNATVEQVQKALDDLKKEHETYWAERDALEKELGKLKAEKRIGELNSAIAEYSEEEQKYAESEINSFKENPLEGDIDAIKSKICVGIVEKQKADAKNSEINSRQEEKVEDIFSEMCEEKSEENDEDVNIF